MNMTTKNNIYQEHLKGWLQAKRDKKKRSAIIKHICFVTGVHPKSVPRSFKRLQMKNGSIEEKRGRREYYTPDVIFALKEVWDIAGEPCGENLFGVITDYVKILTRDQVWKHRSDTTNKLLKMSLGTMKKRVGKFSRKLFITHGKGSTNPSAIHTLIPLRTGPWDTAPIGTLQIDTVAHCGGSLAGDFIYTVNSTDTTTLWGARRAQWNKGQVATVASMEKMKNDLPFPVIEWHPDSGSEFINWHCYNIYKDKLTRSRPNHKNDNCFVEERNGHIIRRWVGYERLDDIKLVKALNSLYDILDPYLNHFVANKRIVSKKRVGARWVITREKTAKTPYERLLQKDDISQETKDKIQQEHDKLNPAILKQEIDKLRKQLFNILKTTRII